MKSRRTSALSTRIVGFRGLSGVWSNALFMEPISDVEHATAVAGSVCAGLDALRGSAFWKIDDKDLLTLAGTLERVGRLVYAAQIRLVGELDTRGVAGSEGAASTMVSGRSTATIMARPSSCPNPVSRSVACISGQTRRCRSAYSANRSGAT